MRRQPERKLQNRLQAFGRGRQAAMADCAEGVSSVLRMAPCAERRESIDVREGVDAPSPDSTLEIRQQIIDGEVAYIIWGGESETLSIPFATDTSIGRDGKIVRQTFAAWMETKST